MEAFCAAIRTVASLIVSYALRTTERNKKTMELGNLPDIYLCRIVFSFTGICLNILNIVVLCVSSIKISPMCRLVINLAAADICVCVWTTAQDFLISINDWTTFSSAASFYTFLHVSSFIGTLLAVILIAINSYFMVVKPLKYSTLFTVSRIRRPAVMMWASAIVESGMSVVFPGVLETKVEQFWIPMLGYDNNTLDEQNTYNINNTVVILNPYDIKMCILVARVF